MKQYLFALATFAGTTIGVGLFGLPFAASKIGLGIMFFYFLLLGGIMLIVNLALGEICLRTPEQHRLPGYAALYLGKKAKILSMASSTVGLYISMIAYIIVGGGFLANLLQPIFGGDQLAYSLIIYASASLIIFLGSKTIARSELVSLVVFFTVLIFLVIQSLPYIRPDSFTAFNGFDLKTLLIPYGIILFALTGASVIPETREMLTGKAHLLKSVIIVGTIIPIITYWIFIYLVLGATGPATTEDALSGLKHVLGERVLIPGFLFGLITTFTSYISIGLTLKKVFWYDFKFSHFNAWVWATMIPLVLYLAGLNNFIAIATFSGAVTMGIDSILIFLIFLKAKKVGQRLPEYRLILPRLILYPVILLLLIGVVLGVIPQ